MSSRFEKIKEREEKLLCCTYGRYPVAVASGKGSRLYGPAGEEYVDLLAGIAVTNLGHCNEEIAEVMCEQARKLVHVSNLFYQEEQLELAEKLIGTTNGLFSKVFFCNSGAESNEAAIKLARRYTQKVKNRDAGEIITLSNAFHGRTLATVAATGQAKFQEGFTPIPQGFTQVEWGNLDALRAAVNGKTAAVLIELVVGSERNGYAIVIKKYSCGPGVFSQYQTGRLKHLQGPDGDVTQVADGGRHQYQLRHSR